MVEFQSMRMKKILIINGPNLNLLGKREITIYGDLSFEEYLIKIRKKYSTIEIDYFQSNVEGEIINKIHSASKEYLGIIINPGAYAHTSISIADAIGSISLPIVEVHISNIYSRENFRHYTLISPKCTGSISGFGLLSYELGVEAILNQTP